MTEDFDNSDTLTVEDEPESSARVLAAIKEAERAFNGWQSYCDEIDEIYAHGEQRGDWDDPDYDLWWASTEVLKPAIYARPPSCRVASVQRPPQASEHRSRAFGALRRVGLRPCRP